MLKTIKAVTDKFARRWLDMGGSGYGYTGGDFYRSRGSTALTSAGTVITEQTAITIPALFHAMRLYAQTIGHLDWSLYEIEQTKDKEGNKYINRSIAVDHPAHRLVHDSPNEYQLSSSFRETMIAHRFLYGNAYAYIQRNGNMRPTAMIPLDPAVTYATRRNGLLQFVTRINNVEQTLQPYEVFHLPGVSLDGQSGLPLVRLMSAALGLNKAEEEWASAFFRNGLNIGGVLEHPQKMSDEAYSNLSESMRAKHEGVGNAYRWAILEEGITAKPFQIDAEKSQIISSRQFSLTVMAQITGLAPHLLYDLSRSTNNNIEQQGIEAVNYSFKPVITKICEEANRKLLYESEKGDYHFVIDVKPLTTGGAKEEAEKDQIRFNTCSITPNEIRVKDGLNPIAGGDELFVNTATLPLNLVVQQTLANIQGKLQENATASAGVTKDELAAAVEDAIKAAAQAGLETDTALAETGSDTPQGDKPYDDGPPLPAQEVQDTPTPALSARALSPVARDVVGRLMRRECRAIAKAVERNVDDPAAFQAWAATYASETRQAVAGALQSVCESVGELTGVTPDAAALADVWVTETTADVAALAADLSKDNADLMLEGYQANRVEKIVKEIVGN